MIIEKNKGFSFMFCYAKNRDGCNFARCKIHQSRRFGGKTLVLDEIFFFAEARMGPMRITRRTLSRSDS